MVDGCRGKSMKLFQQDKRSLFGEILDWMLTPLLLLWPITLALTWLVAQNTAGKPFDRALEHNVNALAQLLSVREGRILFSLPGPAREILRADDTDQVFFQVRRGNGDLLAGEHDLPVPREAAPGVGGEVRLREDLIQNKEVRVAYSWTMVNTQPPEMVLIQVAETQEKRKTLAAEIVKGVMVPQFVTLPLAVLLVWLALVRGIRPLAQLERRIRARKADDMSPLDETAVPEEVAPLVSSINDLLSRLKGSLSTQKRFLADAAHQLKTPLAGLRMQADLAQRQADAEELKRSLQQIGRASVRATHTVNQLLALARAETSGRSLATVRVDLVEVISEAIQESLVRALHKQTPLGLDGPAPPPAASDLQGNATLLREMVRNLIDNAINYTPEGGQVTVRLWVDLPDHALILRVEDTGPGIAMSERERVFQPFYRTLGTNVDGSGLGLAIVAEIARQHGAEVSLDSCGHPEPFPGTRVTVRFGSADGSG
jgi:two-component system sensor histidine kinase TctE